MSRRAEPFSCAATKTASSERPRPDAKLRASRAVVLALVALVRGAGLVLAALVLVLVALVRGAGLVLAALAGPVVLLLAAPAGPVVRGDEFGLKVFKRMCF